MTDSFAALLEIVSEPAFILDAGGRLKAANSKARQAIPQGAFDAVLAAFAVADSAERVLLKRALRVSGGLPGVIVVDGERRRVSARRLSVDGAPLVAFRCHENRDDGFIALNQRIEELHAEIRARKSVQAKLEESLGQNRLLMRELQHRVKNTIQMLTALLSRSAEGAGDEKVTAIVEQANRRLLAISRSYELLYKSQDFATVSARSLIESLAAMSRETMPRRARLEVSLDCDFDLPHERATPLALIAYELLTNAQKHGLQDGEGVIALSLRQEDGEHCLVVRDSGPGFASLDGNSFGLRLVRGLCRQIGARLSLTNDGGAVCNVALRTEAER